MQLPECDREDCFAYFQSQEYSGKCLALRDNNFIFKDECPFYKSKTKWKQQELNSKSMREYSEEKGIRFRDRVLSCYTARKQKEDSKSCNTSETNTDAL